MTNRPLIGGLSSDFVQTALATGEMQPNAYWMREDFTVELSRVEPSQGLWMGCEVPNPRTAELRELWEESVKRYPEAVDQPWELRLAIFRLRKVVTMPGREAISEPWQVTLRPGLRLDVYLKELDYEGKLLLKADLRRRFPRWARLSSKDQFWPFGMEPKENFLVLWKSPSTEEVQVCLNDSEQSWPQNTLLLERWNQPQNLWIAHPSAHMAITGLTLDQWIDGSTLELWYPEFRGVVEMEVPAETVKEAVRLETVYRLENKQVSKLEMTPDQAAVFFAEETAE